MTCTVCRSPKRAEIDRAIIAGEPVRGIARKFNISDDAVFRHSRKHVPARMTKAAERRELSAGSDLVERLLALNRETLAILAGARRSRKHDLALKAIARAESQLELQARLAGEIRDRQVNVLAVNLDPATAERMAAVFLERRARTLPSGSELAIEAESVEREA